MRVGQRSSCLHGTARLHSASHGACQAETEKFRRLRNNPYARQNAPKYPSKQIGVPILGLHASVRRHYFPNGATYISTSCFMAVKVSSTLSVVNKTMTVTIMPESQAGKRPQSECTENIVFMGGAAVVFATLTSPAHTQRVVVNVSRALSDPLIQWYLEKVGMRIFLLRGSYLEAAWDLLTTIDLMAAVFQSPISTSSYLNNYAALTDYIQFSERMQPKAAPRSSGATVARTIDPKHIQSGDALFVYRFDGLDNLIGWGEGCSAGHTVIAMRDERDELFICESTAKTSYWPLNGIQCNEWAKWVDYAEAAQMNVVMVPLSPAYREKFDVAKAWKFFEDTKGLDYGYQIFIFGWIDTVQDNFVCMPPDWNSTCLTPELGEMILVLQDRLMGNLTYNIARQGLNHRMGTWERDLDILQLVKMMHEQGKTFSDVYTMPEQDHWMYRTNRFGVPTVGRQMVCCVFVCSMWKAAGVFSEIDDDIQCGEQTLWDIFSMKIFDDEKMYDKRPEVCRQADPANRLCQMMGNVTYHLQPDVNTRYLYHKMGERCTSKGPHYIRKGDC